MATVISKQADKAHGAVFLQIQDLNGNLQQHTIYVLGLNGQSVDQAITQVCAMVDEQTNAINAAFAAAGLGN